MAPLWPLECLQVLAAHFTQRGAAGGESQGSKDAALPFMAWSPRSRTITSTSFYSLVARGDGK